MTDTAPARRRPSLRRRLLLGLLGYLLLLSAAVAIHGLVVNEQAERLVWQTLLAAELDQLEERQAGDPAYRWRNTRNMSLYDSRQSERRCSRWLLIVSICEPAYLHGFVTARRFRAAGDRDART